MGRHICGILQIVLIASWHWYEQGIFEIPWYELKNMRLVSLSLITLNIET
jgi:hypothetical protein